MSPLIWIQPASARAFSLTADLLYVEGLGAIAGPSPVLLRRPSLAKAVADTTFFVACTLEMIALLTVFCFNRFMFDHCLYFNSSALARLVEREWAAVYSAFDLTPPQGFVLRVVLARPGCLGSEVADVLGISRPTATRLIDNLCAKDLVVRRQAESDGREWRIEPTESGKSIGGPLNSASSQIAKSLRQKIGSTLFDTTVADMRAVRESLD
jgi:MarR family transcriptional regulator, organic hydroperoxide resistance regulator